MGNDRYCQALEGLRERCAQEAERITARSRTLAAMINAEAVKPCEVAAAIRKIDVQQYYECVAKEIEQLREEVERLRRGDHPAITHCDNCGCDWLDNGLNPIGCPYCKLSAETEALRAEVERLAAAVRGWWKAHRPAGWTEDRHRSCPHVNLVTGAEKALVDALLRAREAGND